MTFMIVLWDIMRGDKPNLVDPVVCRYTFRTEILWTSCFRFVVLYFDFSLKSVVGNVGSIEDYYSI